MSILLLLEKLNYYCSMDKLTDKFEVIHFKHVMYQPDDNFKSVQIYAQEAKKLAIEFAKYYIKQDCAKLNNPIAMQLSYLDLEGNSGLYFDKFINEYYE